MPDSTNSQAHESSAKSRTVADWRELRRTLETKNNLPVLAFQILSGEKNAGVQFEKIYDHEHNLLKVKKRSSNSRSETHFDTRSGAMLRTIESSMLPDGCSMMKDISYTSEEKAHESVVVIAPTGELVRKVEREHDGMRTVFQGQTEYALDGKPTTTVNHHMDPISGHMTRREQIIWRGMYTKDSTDNFLFNYAGVLIRFVRTAYGSSNTPRHEEVQEYDPQSQKMTRLVRTEFDSAGNAKVRDSISYTESGEIIHRKTDVLQ